MSKALKPITGMFMHARAPITTNGAYATYSLYETRPKTIHARQWIGNRLTMKE